MCSSCAGRTRSEEHTSELQSHDNLVCRLLLEKKTTAPPVRAVSADRRQRASTLVTTQSLASRSPQSPCFRGAGACFRLIALFLLFFFNNTATPEIHPLPLPVALPI